MKSQGSYSTSSCGEDKCHPFSVAFVGLGHSGSRLCSVAQTSLSSSSSATFFTSSWGILFVGYMGCSFSAMGSPPSWTYLDTCKGKCSGGKSFTLNISVEWEVGGF